MLTRKHESESGREWTMGEQWRQPLAACLARLAQPGSPQLEKDEDQMCSSNLYSRPQRFAPCSLQRPNSSSSLNSLLALPKHPFSTLPCILCPWKAPKSWL